MLYTRGGLAHVVVAAATSLFWIPRAHGDCENFNQDCVSCLQDGCYYCPGDAMCYSNNGPTNANDALFTNCPTSEDYLSSGDSCETPGAVFSDPEYAGQSWVYDMIHVVPVWKQGITGTGVRVRVNDAGFDPVFLADLADRFDEANSCANYLASPDDPDYHGTNVAAILGAGANDGECSVGIAPTVTLSFCDFQVEADLLEPKKYTYDISQNSYGQDGCRDLSVGGRRVLQSASCPFSFFSNATKYHPCEYCEDFSQPSDICATVIRWHCNFFYGEDQPGCLDFLSLILGGNCRYDALSFSERKALSDGISQGREGKGIVYVFASGNAFGQGDETTFQALGNSRFVINVGAVAQDRLHASYSTPGASLFVTGPGGEYESSVSGHITTGFQRRCTDAGGGTSFACPVVSGVIALVLQVNPDLTWRDVQHILAQTSERVDDSGDTTAFQNAAGYWHSHWYGFGIVNAEKAVTAAHDWELVGAEQMLLTETGLLNRPIVDDESTILETSVTVEAPANFVVESVELQLDIISFSRGDLEIILTSPQGTESVLHPGRRPENTQMEDRWKLLTVRDWGEDPNGEWTLTIVDLVQGDVDSCVSQNWTFVEFFFDCPLLENLTWCADGQLDPTGALSLAGYDTLFTHQDNGLLAEEACCACGGGLTTNEVVDQLKQWTLAVYGTVKPARHPLAPSPAPSPSSSSALDGAGQPSSPVPSPSSSALDGVGQTSSAIVGLTCVVLMGLVVLLLP